MSIIKRRNSSVELYRILATLLVLIVHFNGWFVGMPSRFAGFSVFTISQDLIESISCICVNCFLVITGWYGLSFKWKHVWAIYSVLVWIYVPFYLWNSYNTSTFSLFGGLVMSIIAIGRESYYIQCYLMLLFLSPLLNTFISKNNKQILPYVLIFWGIEVVFDWILGNKCLGFGRGYELTHFVLMYLLGRTAFIYKDRLNTILPDWMCAVNCVLGIGLITVMYFFIDSKYCFGYSNPLNVIVSFSLFFLFERKTFHNKLINSIGRSTLAVYIMHITPPLIKYLWDWDNYCLNEYSYGRYLLLMLGTIIIVFIVAVAYDKIKNLFMPQIGSYICNWLNKRTDKILKLND